MTKTVKKSATKFNRALTVVANVPVYVFCTLCLAMLLFTVFSKRDTDGAVKLLGYEMRIVLSGSMEKNSDVDVSDCRIKDIRKGSMVFVQLVPDGAAQAQEFYSRLKVGDVLTFRYDVSGQHFEGKQSPQMTITHRIVDIEPNDTGGYVITLRGDNSSSTGIADVQTIDTSNTASPNYVIGRVTGKSYVLGLLVYSLKRPLGLAVLIIVPCVIVIAWNVSKIVNIAKRKKATE
ncbi:MAG: hypothetical protein J1F68_00620 [Clostridiales bacterium]|nr:hypothetical protein [Clostridiales bacterium]